MIETVQFGVLVPTTHLRLTTIADAQKGEKWIEQGIHHQCDQERNMIGVKTQSHTDEKYHQAQCLVEILVLVQVLAAADGAARDSRKGKASQTYVFLAHAAREGDVTGQLLRHLSHLPLLAMRTGEGDGFGFQKATPVSM